MLLVVAVIRARTTLLNAIYCNFSPSAGTQTNPPLFSFSSNFERTPLLNAMNATIQSEYSVQKTPSGRG